MKKRVLSIVLMLSVILSAAGCKTKESNESSAKKSGKTTEVSESQLSSETEPSETPDTIETDFDGFAFTQANFPVIDGSTSTKPFATAATSITLGIPRSEADKKLEFHKTTQSFQYLMDGTADILICAQPADSVFETMNENGFEYEMEAFSAEALVFVVNTSNPVESLTTEQIQKIYTGEITNWKEVGGEDKEIVAVQRNKEAGSQVMMEKLVMGDLDMMAAPEELMPGDMSGLIEVVKSYDNSAGAIGYTPYYYATNMKMADGLKIIKVDDVMPDTTSIAGGQYPFCTSYYVVIPKNTPDDSPARILFNWILGEDGQKLAEMEGYVPAASSSAPKNQFDVFADWSAYQPAEAADAVFTRLKDAEITDFIVSSDYGHIYPFTGSIKKGYWSYSEKLGFFDDKGRIICDPVYDHVWMISSSDYLVFQYYKNEKSSEYLEKIGVITSDGAHYTGMRFCDYYLRPDGGLSLVERTSDGINVYPYDSSGSSLGNPAAYKLNISGESLFMYSSLYRIIDDRYLVFYNDEGWGVSIYDGDTGYEVSFGDTIETVDCHGNLIEGYDSSSDASGSMLFDVNGKEIRKDFGYVEAVDKDMILFHLPTGWEVADVNGNVINSLANRSFEIKELYKKPDAFVAKKKDSIDLYDLKLNLIKSVKLTDAEDYSIASSEDEFFEYRFSSSFDVDLYAYHVSADQTSIINLNTEKSVTIDGEYQVSVMPQRLLLSEIVDSGPERWMILDSSDYHKIGEGEGQFEVFEDMEEHKYYLTVGKEYWSDTLSIVDIETGKAVWESLPNPRSDILSVEYIYDGHLVYSTRHNYDSYEITTTSTNMIDKDGKVLFLYNSVYLPDD